MNLVSSEQSDSNSHECWLGLDIFIVSAVTDQQPLKGKVAPGDFKRMKSNEQVVPYNRYQPLCRRSLCVVSWLHLRSIAGTCW